VSAQARVEKDFHRTEKIIFRCRGTVKQFLIGYVASTPMYLSQPTDARSDRR